MENVHAERSAGWSVLCYVGVLVIATLLTTGMPSVGAKASDAATAIDAHRTSLLWGAWLTFPAAGFFLWFLVGLRSYLSYAPGRQEGLATFALAAGIAMVATSLFAAALQTAAVYSPPDMFTANGLAGVYNAFVFVQSGLGYAPVSIFLLAAANSMRRHGSAPRWLSTFGYIASVGAALSTLSIFFTDGVMAVGNPGAAIFGALPTALWLIATGIVLIQSKRGSGSESTSGAS